MRDFAEGLRERWAADRPDVVHAHFWMSGLAALHAARALGIPVVHTFHALGVVKRRHQGDADTSPPHRIATEAAIAGSCDRIVATCSDEVFELVRHGRRPAADLRGALRRRRRALHAGRAARAAGARPPPARGRVAGWSSARASPTR